EEIYNSSSKDGDPDETWHYDYTTNEGAYLKECYIGDDDDASEIIVYSPEGDIIKVSANPDASGDFQSIITIQNTYDTYDNILSSTTTIDISGTDPESQTATYEYEYDPDNNNLERYEAVEVGDNGAVIVTHFIWE
ncbi:MAG: hypothetical protein JRF40_12565, partial [Deltaproteobacteria bacterium]|nr:hypothetical protein [Deltaproteobacteria bacterium]